MAESSLPRLLSVARAAEHLDCSRAHIYGLISAGKLRAVETKAKGRRSKTRVYEEDLAAFIEANTRGSVRGGDLSSDELTALDEALNDSDAEYRIEVRVARAVERIIARRRLRGDR